MIKVVSFKRNSLSIGFKIEGHALSRKEMENTIGDAYDMICNSVSVLSQGILIGMVEVLKLPVKYEINDGFLSLDLSTLNEEMIMQGQTLLLTFEKSIDDICNPMENSLYEKLSRIKKEFVTQMDDRVAKMYYITSLDVGSPKKIALPNELIFWEK